MEQKRRQYQHCKNPLPDGMQKAVEAQERVREGFLEKVTKVICLKDSSEISQVRKEEQAKEQRNIRDRGAASTEAQRCERGRNRCGVQAPSAGAGEAGRPITRGAVGLRPHNQDDLDERSPCARHCV